MYSVTTKGTTYYTKHPPRHQSGARLTPGRVEGCGPRLLVMGIQENEALEPLEDELKKVKVGPYSKYCCQFGVFFFVLPCLTIKSADPCLALAQAGRRPGSPQVCGFGLLGPRPAWSTRHQTLCHCLPKSPRTRCPAAAVLCQRLASRHTPCRGFQNVREARPITTQNPVCGPLPLCHCLPRSPRTRCPAAASRHKTPLWAFTALPLPSQVTANTLPCSGSPLPAPGHVAILHLEGFKTCAKHGPSRHKTPLWAFTALPLPSQVTANTLPCSGSPLPAPGLSPYSI